MPSFFASRNAILAAAMRLEARLWAVMIGQDNCRHWKLKSKFRIKKALTEATPDLIWIACRATELTS